MHKKSPEEMERARIIKVARTLLRLKHSLRADEEINEFLPDTLDAFDAATSAGELQGLKYGLYELLERNDASGD